MNQSFLLSLEQVVSLTDEALLLLDPASLKVRFASPRALYMLESAEDAGSGPLTDLLDPDEGRLQRFLADAATVSSPLIGRVLRRSDGAPLTAKARRLNAPSGEASVILALKDDTDLSRRFRILADKIRALDAEIEQRRAVEARLSQSSAALERALLAVRQMSEIDTSDPEHLRHALDALRSASGSSGALVIGVDWGRLLVRAASGSLAENFEGGEPVDLPGGLGQLWDLPEDTRLDRLRTSLEPVTRGARDLSDLEVWPLYIGSAPKALLLLQRCTEGRHATEILAEAFASLMSRISIETELRHAQKLQAIGELTGGIAHDFNNLLAVVLGNAELILDHVARLGPDALEVELAGDIRDAALRGATLTSRLLSFARKQPLRPQALALNGVLRDLDALLRRAIGETIKVEIVGAGGLWTTRLDQSQFENALLNLAVNARDAMPEGGRLTIETQNARLDAEYAAQHAEVNPGQYVMVAVSDTGTGMSTDVMREAFTPFFTTKGVGRGNGLGLSMVFGFVKQSGGHIKIYSELDHGTTVKMYFPRDLSSVSAEEAARGADPLLQRGTAQGRVLVVEDDPALLRYAERALRVLGYSVETALSGDDAAELIRARSYDILLTDVVLPGRLNGARLAELAVKVDPQIKVLFMSGYTENSIVHNGQLDPGVELISKPFTRDL